MNRGETPHDSLHRLCHLGRPCLPPEYALLDEAPVKLVRRGVLVCTTFGCDFTLFTLDTVRSTQ
jgi:hypothetical protein